ncbi:MULTISPECIES: flavoprotein [Streptomyces]|uniref:Flavoprotein n=1 Tax=Streptomyces fimbriatus TaxID=68197 RepID=A0ABW0D5R9_STRFI|nr:flavoprotein [Streptomyces sp.]
MSRSEPSNPFAAPAPTLGMERLLLVGTGALHAWQLPTWVSWLRLTYPDLALRTVVTRSAERFVTRPALDALSGSETLVDEWPAGGSARAVHVELAQWADAVLVYPATVNFISRYAAGITDTPVLLALQCLQAPVAVAPCLPPGADRSETVREHLATLAARSNVVVAPTTAALSVTTGRHDAQVPPPLPAVIERLEAKRTALRAEAA